MIHHLSCANFKAFESVNIELKPITVLLGPNNSGKSSIISALRILVQTVESYDPQIPILLNGIMGDFGTYRDVVFNNHPRRRISISIASTHTRVPRAQQLREVNQPFWNIEEERIQNIELKYRYRTGRREIVLDGVRLEIGNTEILKTKYSGDSERQLIESIGKKTVPTQLKSSISRHLRMHNFIPRFFIPTRLLSDSDSAIKDFISKDMERDLRVLRSPYDFSNQLRNVEYLGPMRLPPSRTFLFTGERRKRIGINGEHALSVLVMDSFRGGEKSSRIVERVSNWLNKAGIASDLIVKRLTDRHYEIRVQHPKTEEYQNFADVGYGNSQVLPVLIGGYNIGTGSTYIVEEPEIHLHPKAQAELGDFFLELYDHGIQSIIETHSEHMILRLQQHVAARNIPPEHVAVYYVSASEKEKFVQQLRLNQSGKFIDTWPEGFFPERLAEAKKLSQIRYKMQLGSDEEH